MISAVACEQGPSARINSVSLPDESLEGDFFYLDEPVLLDADKFDICLDILAEQLTVLYLRSDAYSDEQTDAGLNVFKRDLVSLREIQKDYYRYGVLVLMIDRGRPTGWTNFKRKLESVEANFRVAYLEGGDEGFLKSFLKTDLSAENEFWLVDMKRKIKIKLEYPITQGQLELRVEQILKARYTPGVKLCF